MIEAVPRGITGPLQQPATVGDTVWVAMTVRVPPRMIVRPQTWDLGELGQVLGPPDLTFTGDSARISYPVTIWYPGEHALRMPGPIVVSPEGQSDTLPAVSARVSVLSVLPPDSSRSELEPRPPAAPIPQTAPSFAPVLSLLLLASVVLGLAYLAWRRRDRLRRARVPQPVPANVEIEPMLSRWAAAGELRAALDGWAHVLERRSRERGEPPAPHVAAWLAAAERAGFQSRADLAELERLLASVPSMTEVAASAAPQETGSG